MARDFHNWNNEPAIDVEHGASSGRSRHVAPDITAARYQAERRKEKWMHRMAFAAVFVAVLVVLYVLLTLR